MPGLIHQSALFNPLSGYGSYIFPAVAPIIVYQTIVLVLPCLWQVIVRLYGVPVLVIFGNLCSGIDHWLFVVFLFIWFCILVA